MIRTAQPAHRAIRRKLLISCASVAIATVALTPQKARAQVAGAFRGTITSTTGDVTRNTTSGTAETITIGTNNATINWNPTGTINQSGNIDFLPDGNTATFQGTAAAGDYTVLNRVLPDGAYPIELDGTVNSLLSDASKGGRIWFYSPNGIVIGSTAAFDVGSLLLTTADPEPDGPGWSTTADGFNLTTGTASSASKIQILEGAQLKALQQNSYIALIAPRIEQGGNVQVNGSAGYFAGEQMTMTFSQGLFDVSIDVGTEDSTGILHTGTTGGPANATATDAHRIYMAAVPKNLGMTMLLGGNIGFDDVTTEGAAAGVTENGEIWLSAGWAPYHDENGEGFQASDTDLATDAAMTIANGHLTSPVQAIANGYLFALATTADLTFDDRAFLESYKSSVIAEASGSNTLSFDDPVNSVSLWSGPGGEAMLGAYNGGTIDIAANATLHASAAPVVDTQNGDMQGGSVEVDADGGTINAGNLSLYAGASGADSEGTGGIGTGGNINIGAYGGGTIAVTGNLSADATGTGGSGQTGGEGRGGYVRLQLDGGDIAVGGQLSLDANGTGGGGTLAGGDGHGGEIFAGIGGSEGASAGGNLAVTSDLILDASGIGGAGAANAEGVGGIGGDGYGGSAELYTTNYLQPDAIISVNAGTITVGANGNGGTGGDGIRAGAGGAACAGGTYGPA
jgi:filamentous hemagglutinin family protein